MAGNGICMRLAALVEADEPPVPASFWKFDCDRRITRAVYHLIGSDSLHTVFFVGDGVSRSDNSDRVVNFGDELLGELLHGGPFFACKNVNSGSGLVLINRSKDLSRCSLQKNYECKNQNRESFGYLNLIGEVLRLVEVAAFYGLGKVVSCWLGRVGIGFYGELTWKKR